MARRQGGTMKGMFLFARPPRPLWPFNGTGSAFWPPLAFASMAAALRQALPQLPVGILDSPVQKKGWKSFEAELRRLRPAYLGIGEEAVSCKEGLRAAKLATELGAKVIAGGCFFGNVASEMFSTRLVDVVVHGEGERTIVDVVRALESGDLDALREVRGVSFRNQDEVAFTGMREPMDDLDSLPMPAFDLLPMEMYGRDSRNHPALVSLELGRGCPHECSFCVLWRQMGKFRPSGPASCYRAKSPERLVEEIRYVTQRFRRKYIGWVDPCFNASATLPRELAELLLSSDIKIGQSAWVRADYLRRDAASGALDRCVETGLNELYIGLERRSHSDLNVLNKNCAPTDAEIALKYIAERHPNVCKVGSFIFGIPGETRQSVRKLIEDACELPLDLSFFIPLTPLPGTPFWNREDWDGTGDVFSNFNFLPGSANGNSELEGYFLKTLLTYWPGTRIRGEFLNLFVKDSRRRRIAHRHFGRSFSFLLRSVFRDHGVTCLQLPSWYES